MNFTTIWERGQIKKGGTAMEGIQIAGSGTIVPNEYIKPYIDEIFQVFKKTLSRRNANNRNYNGNFRFSKRTSTIQTNHIITSPSTHYRQQRANIALHSFLDNLLY